MMTYVIRGLDPAPFRELAALSDAELAGRNIVRRRADSKPGFPCRVTLEDAEPGETLLLLNYEDHSVATPYRNAYAIYVRETAEAAPELHDTLPPVFAGRPIALRAFDSDGMLQTATLALQGDADARIRDLFALPRIAYINAHNAAHGCFAARIDRD
jgi:hypothetical protein